MAISESEYGENLMGVPFRDFDSGYGCPVSVPFRSRSGYGCPVSGRLRFGPRRFGPRFGPPFRADGRFGVAISASQVLIGSTN